MLNALSEGVPQLPDINPLIPITNPSGGILSHSKRTRYVKAIRRYHRLLLKKQPLLRVIAYSLATIWTIILLFLLYRYFRSSPASDAVTVAVPETVDTNAGFSYDKTKRAFGEKCAVGVGNIPLYTPTTNRIDTWDFKTQGPLTQKHFYQNYVAKNKPLLIKNSINDWPALTSWKSDDYLREKVGTQMVGVERSLNNKFGYAEETWKMKSRRPMSEFLDVYKSKDANGVLYYMDSEIFPSLENDFIQHKFVPCLTDAKVPYFTEFGVWFGGGGQNSLVHSDPEDNLLNILDGWKRLILFAPQDGEYLYEDRTGEARTSKLNIGEPDLTKYPLFPKATPYEVITGPGDVLFIPAYWFHQVESSCRHIAINFWFDSHDGRGMIRDITPQVKKDGVFPTSKDTIQALMKRKSECPIMRKWDLELAHGEKQSKKASLKNRKSK